MIILAGISLPVILLIMLYAGVFGHLQTKAELRNFKNANASVVFAEGGELIGKFFSENRTNITYGQVPLHLRNALIATEDARFFEHNGIDSRSMFRVIVKSLLLNDQGSGGGSTITQQLAKNMFGRRSFGPFTVLINKSKEILLARRIENTFGKEDILTLYLNTVPFGGNIYGIEAAAGRYFNKKTELLNIEESALLIGMLKANTYYNPVLNPENALNRRNVVLMQMVKYDYLSSAEADSLSKLLLKKSRAGREPGNQTGYFLVRVKSEAQRILRETGAATGKEWNIEEDGLIITTTLNNSLQHFAVQSFRRHMPVMQKRLTEQYQTPSGKRLMGLIVEGELKRLNFTDRANEIQEQLVFDWNGTVSSPLSVTDSLKQALLLLHAGLLAIDPRTGAVRAYVGGIDFRTQQYDQINARRQLASVFKPVLFAAAFEEGMEPCQYLDNDSVILSGFDNWTPENYDHSYGGKYSLAGALTHSMNVPAFSLYMTLGFDKIDTLWKKMGFSFPLDNTPSLALGTAEASIREVAAAYSAFANGGFPVTPHFVTSIRSPGGEIIYQYELGESGERVISERTSMLMNAILQKAAREGTGATMGSVYGVDMPLAGKTGTSQDYADAWFVGYNPQLTIVARVGASSHTIHFNNGSYGSGSALALPLVGLTLQQVQRDQTLREELISSFPELPSDLEALLDCPDFKEKNLFDRFIDILQKNRVITDDREIRVKKKREPFFRRIFRR